MKKSTLLLSSAFTALVLPAIASAQNFFYISNWIGNIKVWLSQAVTIAMILITLFFIVSVIRYIRAKDAADVEEKRHLMIQSLIGLFVAVSVWGIIGLAGAILGTDNYYGNNPTSICRPGTTNVAGKCI